MRDPRIEPEKGDKLFKKSRPEKFLIIDFLAKGNVYYRVFLNDDFLFAGRCKIDRFKELALKEAKLTGGKTDEKP